MGVVRLRGIATFYDSNFEEGWRSEDLQVVFIATWDGFKHEVFTNIDLSERILGCPINPLKEWPSNKEYVGHNLVGSQTGQYFDLMDEVKKITAKYLDNEGKRCSLGELARWNQPQPLINDLGSKMRRLMAWRKGQHIKVARWCMEDARLCYDIFTKVRRNGEIRFKDNITGKKPFVKVNWVVRAKGEEE